MKSQVALVHRNHANLGRWLSRWLPILLAPALVSAAPIDVQNFLNVFIFKGQLLQAIFSNDYAVFGLTVFFFTLMLYNMFVPLIGKIPVFAGDGKNAASKYGRIVAMCLSGLSSMSIFAYIFLFRPERDIKYVIRHTLGPFATFAGVLLSLLMFAIIYFGFKDLDSTDAWKRGIWGVGVFMIFFGTLMARPGWFMIGWAITLIMLILMMTNLFKSGSSGSGGGGDGKTAKDTIILKGRCVKLDATGALVGVDKVTVEATDTNHSKYTSVAATGADGNFVIKITGLTEPIEIESICDKDFASKNFTPNPAQRGDTEYNMSTGSPYTKTLFPVKLSPGKIYDKFSSGRYIRISMVTRGTRTISGKVYYLGQIGNPAAAKAGVRVHALCYSGAGGITLQRDFISEPSAADGSYKIVLPDDAFSEKFDLVFLIAGDYLLGTTLVPALDPANYSGSILKWWASINKLGYFTPKAWGDSKPIANADIGIDQWIGLDPTIESSESELGEGNLKGKVTRST